MEQMITEGPVNNNPNLSGWICPRCGRAVSPTVKVCPCSKPDNNCLENNEEMILS